MASYTVLAAPENKGFLTGLGRGIESSAGKYFEAAQKRQDDEQRSKERNANMNKFAEAMQQGGFEPTSATMGMDGNPSYSYRKKEPQKVEPSLFSKDPVKAMRQAVLAPDYAETLGKEMGVTQPPEPMMSSTISPVLQGLLNPRQKQMFDNTESYATPEQKQSKYVDAVRNRITDSYAPGVPKDQAIRELFNVPIQTPQEKQQAKALPEEFGQDVRDIVEQSNKDENVFMRSLADLAATKYADNPEALAKIDKLIRMTKASMPKQTAQSQEDELMGRIKF